MNKSIFALQNKPLMRIFLTSIIVLSQILVNPQLHVILNSLYWVKSVSRKGTNKNISGLAKGHKMLRNVWKSFLTTIHASTLLLTSILLLTYLVVIMYFFQDPYYTHCKEKCISFQCVICRRINFPLDKLHIFGQFMSEILHISTYQLNFY